MGNKKVLLFDLVFLSVLLLALILSLQVVTARDPPKTPLSPHFHANIDTQNKSETVGNQLPRVGLSCCDDCRCDWMDYCTCEDSTWRYCNYGCSNCQCNYRRPPYSCYCADMLDSCPRTCMEDRDMPKSRALGKGNV